MSVVEIFDNTAGSGGQDHSHLNLLILNQVGEVNGQLTYRGFIVSGGAETINDTLVSLTKTFSSQKISTELAKKMNTDLLGVPGGVAPLGSDGKVPMVNLPSNIKEIRVVPDIATRDAITEKFAGLKVLVLDAFSDPEVAEHTSAEYTWTGSAWFKNVSTSNVVLDWTNIQGKPSSNPSAIDLAVMESHLHSNPLILEGLGEDNGNLTFKGKPVALAQGNVFMFVPDEKSLPAQGTLNVIYIISTDSTNMNRPTMCIWDATTSTYQTLGGSGGGSSSGLQQVTKLNVVAPKKIDLTIPESTDFIFPEVVVLKFVAGIQDQLLALCEFTNAESVDFVENPLALFDGSMKLKTTLSEPMTAGGTAGTFTVQEFVFDTTKYTGITALAIG